MPNYAFIWKEVDFSLNKNKLEREAEIRTLQFLLYTMPNMFIHKEWLFGEFEYDEELQGFLVWDLGISNISGFTADKRFKKEEKHRKSNIWL